MRVSDRARDQAVTVLRRRWTEGYLTLDTYERRVEQAFRARDSRQLASLLSDLPPVGLLARVREWRLGAEPVAPEAMRLPLELVTERPITLGRSRQCDVVVAHDTVSRHHAELWREGERCYIADLGSSNGTFVEGRRVDDFTRVRGGDQILLGGCLVAAL